MNENDERYRAGHAPPPLGGLRTLLPPIPVMTKTPIPPEIMAHCVKIRKIYIAKDGDGDTLGIVLAESEGIAHAYFVGRGEIPHTMRTIDPTDESLGVMGLVTLFKTSKHHSRDFRDRTDRMLILEDKS